MHVIYKYIIRVGNGTWLTIPRGAEVLHVGAQGSAVCIWAKVDPEAAPEARTFYCCATGETIPEASKYVGTAVTEKAQLVWHVFELL